MTQPQQAKSSALALAFKAQLAGTTNTDLNSLSQKLANLILQHAMDARASDVHFDPKADSVQVRFRIDGLLYDQLSYPKNELPIIPSLRVAAGFPPRAAMAYTSEDGRFSVIVDGIEAQMRVSSFPSIHGEKLVVRILGIKGQVPPLTELGMSDDILAQTRRILHSPNGLFIVAGMTGCGKSTTIASMLQEISRPELNIMTLEDPVEYVLPRATHAQVNHKAGFSFADGLRNILRQDPDVVMVGEIRDEETAATAINAAISTGHLLLSTVHSASSPGVIHRLSGVSVEPYMLASSLLGVLSQRLARKLCPACSVPAQPSQAFMAALSQQTGDPSVTRRQLTIASRPGAAYRKPKGCPECNMTGYKGRVGIFELMLLDEKFRSVISAKSVDIVTLKRAAAETGMATLMDDALAKASMGLTSLEEVSRVVIGGI